MPRLARSLATRPRRLPGAIVAAALAMEFLYVGMIVAVGGIGALLTPFGLGGVVLTLPFFLGTTYGGYRLSRSDVSVERYPRIARWCVGVTGLYLGLNLVLVAVFSPWQGFENTGWFLFSTMIGLAGGLALGLIEARAIERAVTAEREAIRTEQLEKQRDWFEYLNGLLRHEVLNSAHLIDGYVDLLRDEVDVEDPRWEYLDRIGRRSRRMTEVIQDVRVLLQSTDGRDEFEPVDVVDLLSSEVSALLDEHEGLLVETNWPEEVHVPADDLLARVFSNLLANAIEHHDDRRPTVRVAVETTADAARVTIMDDGPGGPSAERETLFERSGGGDHGFGLYLVDRLVDRFGGTIELTETGPEGSTFTVELPRADPDDGAPAGEPTAAANAYGA